MGRFTKKAVFEPSLNLLNQKPGAKRTSIVSPAECYRTQTGMEARETIA